MAAFFHIHGNCRSRSVVLKTPVRARVQPPTLLPWSNLVSYLVMILFFLSEQTRLTAFFTFSMHKKGTSSPTLSSITTCVGRIGTILSSHSPTHPVSFDLWWRSFELLHNHFILSSKKIFIHLVAQLSLSLSPLSLVYPLAHSGKLLLL